MKRLIIALFFTITSVYFSISQILEIPFELKNDIILIQVKINDHEDIQTFIFDTGATSDVLDYTIAKKMGIRPNYKQKVPGAGGKKTYEIALNQKITLQDSIHLTSSNLVLVDLQNLQSKLEKDFNGIIGYSLLQRYVTKIDYDNNKILLFENINEVEKTGFKPIPFLFHGGIPIPQFDISIRLNNDEILEDKIFFDSGAALTLSVNTPYKKKNKLLKKVDRTLISETENLNSQSISEDIAIKSMQIGDFELNEMVISLSNDKSGTSSYKGYLGILGAKVIRRFNVILDYSQSTLYLKPNKSINEKFEFPVSGLTLKKMQNEVIIHRVQKRSPAYEKGIRKNDRLISINSVFSKDIEIYRKMLKKEGDLCRLKLLSEDGKTKEIEIKLERLL